MAGAPNPTPTDRGSPGLVLFVDGEAAAQQTAKTALEASGFSVLLAGDGREGVQIFRQRADEIRVVILGLNLPDQTGHAAFQEIRRIRPTARFILLSDEPIEEIKARFAGADWVDFLQKPFRSVQFIEQVQAAFGRRRFSRLTVSLPVIGWVSERSGQELRGYLHQVGEGGLEAEFPAAVAPGSHMSLLLQTRHGLIEVEGTVVHARATGTTVRHGLAFPEPKDLHFVLDLFFHESW